MKKSVMSVEAMVEMYVTYCLEEDTFSQKNFKKTFQKLLTIHSMSGSI